MPKKKTAKPVVAKTSLQRGENSTERLPQRKSPTPKKRNEGISEEAIASLESEYRHKWNKCQACPLHRTAYSHVLYRGSLPAEIMLIGEAPGETENLTGQPFVGRSGKLLDQLFEEVHRTQQPVQRIIANTVCCIPWKNENQEEVRPPTPQELDKCYPHLEQLLGLCRPKVVILVGKTASKVCQKLVKSRDSGRTSVEVERKNSGGVSLHPFRITEIPHPAYMLRTGGRTSHSFQQAYCTLISVYDYLLSGTEPNGVFKDPSNLPLARPENRIPTMPVTRTKKRTFASPSPKKSWDLYKDGLRQSTINLFLVCREQFRISTIQNLRSTRISDAVHFGNLFHFCLEHILCEKPKDVEWCITTLQDIPGIDPTQEAYHHLALAQISVMLPHYLDFWEHRSPNSKTTWIAREKEWSVPYMQSSHPISSYDSGNNTSSNRPIPLSGIFDGVYETEKKGKHQSLAIYECKTKGQVNVRTISGMLSYDLQTLMYAIAAQTIYKIPVTHVCYDVIRRPQSKPKVKESLQEYIGRLDKEVSKNPDYFFTRLGHTITPRFLEHWRTTVFDRILHSIQVWWEGFQDMGTDSPHHFVNPLALEGKYGSLSDYYDAIVNNDTTGLASPKKQHDWQRAYRE